MTQQPVRLPSSSSGWQWPIDPTAYDRSPDLSEREQEELTLLVQRFQRGKSSWPKRTYRGLQRLLSPLQDVLTLIDCPLTSRRGVLHLVLQEMQQRQHSFWGWTPQAWLDLLECDATAFAKHSSRNKSSRPGLLAIAYLLGDFADLLAIGPFDQPAFAKRVFGREAIDAALAQISQALHRLGFGASLARFAIPSILCLTLLVNRSPRLEDLTIEVLETVRTPSSAAKTRRSYVALSRALVSLGILTRPLNPAKQGPAARAETVETVPTTWLYWCQRWQATSTQAHKTRRNIYTHLLKVGRWMSQTHPEILSPADWTRDVAAAFVAAVDQMTVGQWAHPGNVYIPLEKRGKPLAPNSKIHQLSAVRVFFRECQEWGWIPRRFDPRRSLATPRAIRTLTAPNPRTIADDIWAKLLWAGLNLTADDLPICTYLRGSGRRVPRASWYPLELVRAIALVWLFAGLRSDELYRLRVGAVRWQREDVLVPGTENLLPKDAVCMLDVPTHKTGAAYTKPVDRVVGEAITAWERVRPMQPALLDPKTGELVDYLFQYRSIRVGTKYLNATVIPMLCQKAGVPESDARGPITSHRARSTIASQLFNAKEPMSLFELQEWLGHRSPASTQHYAKLTPTKLAKSYADAGYFGRNTRVIEVLIDQENIKSGAAAAGEPWKVYDLGHGYCAYEFFDQCPHRMACAKCAFYRPKGSTHAQLLEGKANLQRMLQAIPLTEDERAAVEDGLTAMEHLCQQLADVPTPAGPTPTQLTTTNPRESLVIPVAQIGRRSKRL